ncbi:DUF3038 domain-containing protein [Cyanobium sp. WAJ14-Wanaka]|uniref:DUF3038 domain-containing protein n=1 Tax=Cyanobium sp. WAJ14-Wanaka TaxID=2823725 RepID=UPI0020CBE2E2|nr:DUF3038 domain-containing protein [Cyanobium sp. WAJ14-Wanaka]MCP9774352.1 DUF3038 domain-containing protein [Cyanobium sp. WAJ14-Wanaka]
MPHDYLAPQTAQDLSRRALSRRGLERLDLLLLSLEALDYNGGEALVWMSEHLGFQDLFPNRVELWKSRCHNPLRRNTRRGVLNSTESDALIRILCGMADRLYPLVRSLLSQAEAPELLAQRWEIFHGRLSELVRERMNLRRGGVQKLLNREQGMAQCRQLIQALALGSGAGGFDRLKSSLLDAAA